MLGLTSMICEEEKSTTNINGGDPTWWVPFIQKFHFPQFYRFGQKKMARKKKTHTHTNLWGFFMCPSFFFFLLSAFFSLSFSSLPLLFDILKPKKVPTRWGLWHINNSGEVCRVRLYTEQMDAEGLGRKLLPTPLVTSAEPLKSRLWVLCLYLTKC